MSGDQDQPASGSSRRKPRPELTPVQRALGLLTRREHSRKELARKLAARGIAPDDAHAAVETLAAAGWQDDARFAQSLLRSRAGNGYGPVRIRAELATHGLERDCVEAAFDAFDGGWVDSAGCVVQRRFEAALRGDAVLRRKAADFLFRRGFTADQIRASIRPNTDAR